MKSGLTLLLLLWSWLAWAGATATAVTGTVRLTPSSGQAAVLATGQRVESGAKIETGPSSSAVLRFDDGQTIALVADTSFKVDDYRFDPHKPETGNFAATLLRGALRAITGLIGEANKSKVAIKTDTATVGIRGTDFNLHFDRRLYIQVMEGAVITSNAGGQAVFDAAQLPFGLASSQTLPPQAIDAAELPAAVLADFRVLAATPLTGRERAPNPNDPNCSSRR
jgi:hypothetical protein